MSTDWRPVRHLLRCSCRHGHPGSANYAPAFLGSSGATYAAIANRRGTKIATIAIARKLLTRAYHLLARWRGAGWVLARPLRPPRRGQPRHSPRRPRLRKCMCRCTCRSLTIPPRRRTMVGNRRTRLFSRHSPALPGTPRQRRRAPLPPQRGPAARGPRHWRAPRPARTRGRAHLPQKTRPRYGDALWCRDARPRWLSRTQSRDRYSRAAARRRTRSSLLCARRNGALGSLVRFAGSPGQE